jgi:hypothetical protein
MVTPAEPVLKTKMEDMGSLRGPRKPAGKTSSQLNSFEILKRYIPKEIGPTADVNKTLNQISSLIGLGLARIVQIGNTVFLIMPKGGQTVELHTASEEPMSELPKRLVALSKTLKQMGFKKAVSYAPSQHWIKIVQQSGLPIKVTQGKQKIGPNIKPMYQFMVDL